MDEKQKAEEILKDMGDYFDKVKQVADNYNSIYDEALQQEEE